MSKKSLKGKLVSVEMAQRLALRPGETGEGFLMQRADVGIVTDETMEQCLWMFSYTKPSLWVHVVTPRGSGWFNTATAPYKVVDAPAKKEKAPTK